MGLVFGPRRYFGLAVEGLEALPPAPVLLVANHSGGSSIADVWGLAVGWYRHFGAARPLHVLGHELLFSNPVTGRFFERLGVLRATQQIGHRVLREFGRDLLVMPGGDLEVWRPYRDRFRVDFAGRRGYARLAVELGVPVVPVAHAGAHETLYVLTSGRALARRLGLHRLFRASVWPVHLSLPWGLAIGPLPHIPWPARFRYRFGAPIFPSTDSKRARGAAGELDVAVRRAIQHELDVLSVQAMRRRSVRGSGPDRRRVP